LKSEGIADENDGNALLLLLEVVGQVDKRPIHRLHLCHNWHTQYWKSLVDLLACLAIAETHKVYPRAHCVSNDWLGPILSGKALIGYDYEFDGDLAIPDQRRWMITEVLYDPESFVSEMVKECGDREILLGFERWSDYLTCGTVALERGTDVQGYLKRIEAGMQALEVNGGQDRLIKTRG